MRWSISARVSEMSGMDHLLGGFRPRAHHDWTGSRRQQGNFAWWLAGKGRRSLLDRFSKTTAAA
jgi:hypothetical protein